MLWIQKIFQSFLSGCPGTKRNTLSRLLCAKQLSLAQKIPTPQIARGWESIQGALIAWDGSVLYGAGYLLSVTVRGKSLGLPLVCYLAAATMSTLFLTVVQPLWLLLVLMDCFQWSEQIVQLLSKKSSQDNETWRF